MIVPDAMADDVKSIEGNVAVLSPKSSTDIAYAVEGGNVYFDKSTGTITDCDTSVTSAVIPSKIDVLFVM